MSAFSYGYFIDGEPIFDDDPNLAFVPDDEVAFEMEARKEADAFERLENERQARIDAGVEHACVACGCSESRACPGGCVWATASLCSRCL